jgi:hypothetical protein
MERTTFSELWLRLGSAGAANLYCHAGGCEHLLSFVVRAAAGRRRGQVAGAVVL